MKSFRFKRYQVGEIKKHDDGEFWRRLEKYQKDNNTTGIPKAWDLGLVKIGYSAGVYGCNGTLYEDIETGDVIGAVGRGYNIYVE